MISTIRDTIAAALRGVHRRFGAAVLAVLAFSLASGFALLIAWGASVLIENRSATAVSERLQAEGFSWATVTTDGLQVRLSGTAPNEAARFRAVNLTGTIVDSARIADDMEVTAARAIEAPRFSVEMLRNDDGIQLIGLLPAGGDETRLQEAARALMPGTEPAEMIETATYPAPPGWEAAFDYGIAALRLLPRSKISVDAERVEITAIATSAAEKRQFESQLGRNRPAGVTVTVGISAPRPVLTPFTLRFLKDAEGARFDACSADSERARDRILAAAVAAGAEEAQICTIGLGVPSPSWAAAAEAGIHAISELGAGTITISDADVTLVASEDVPQATFDRVIGELQTALPPVFSLDATLPKKQVASPAGPAEFTAALNAETGRVELRGRLTDDMQRQAVDSFARARFGADRVYIATRLDPELPGGWPVRVLAALEALAELDGGSALVREDLVEVKGVTGSQDARARISQLLSGRLGQGQTFRVDVRYDEALDPLAALPTPQECHAEIATLLGQEKIAFAPGSAEIDGRSGPILSRLADILRKCEGIRMEIGGHTDSQGSDEGNRALSQARAEAVLLSLQGRRVDVSYLRATGYGENTPIADNATEEGREANRRIEFTLLNPDGSVPAAETALEQPADGAETATGPEAVADQDAVVVADAGGGAGSGPVGATPQAEACRTGINGALAQRKISFTPGSAQIAADSEMVVRRIADLLKTCPGVPFEVGGHTDSQGSEGGNQRLSQQRANAVLLALAEQGADVSVLKSIGYGEANPIADNGTEEGREANRRIEFFLIGRGVTATDPAPSGDAVTSASETGDGGAAVQDETATQEEVPDQASEGEAAADPGGATAEDATPADAVDQAADEDAEPDSAAGTAEAVVPSGSDAEGAIPAPAQTGATQTGADAALADEGPDFSGDDSPSVAPQEKTQRPLPRPARNG